MMDTDRDRFLEFWDQMRSNSENQEAILQGLWGKGIEGLDEDWQKYVKQDPAFYRPAEVDTLLGDSTKARTELGWKPECSFEQLVQMMVDADLAALGGKS